ncbi:LAME_0A07140g1_1 [Lachancea meyersii CBS 8951]|uniref:LAME_0A07140g1_1 n=1 Tax=Lachancea meyersii CBS 8951 TaxID=1266667 RepID=A0A1G4IQM3_9SACH|nr:LAME_0A07140g1_1 [Lachancea meyersii CBS 8951]
MRLYECGRLNNEKLRLIFFQSGDFSLHYMSKNQAQPIKCRHHSSPSSPFTTPSPPRSPAHSLARAHLIAKFFSRRSRSNFYHPCGHSFQCHTCTKAPTTICTRVKPTRVTHNLKKSKSNPALIAEDAVAVAFTHQMLLTFLMLTTPNFINSSSIFHSISRPLPEAEFYALQDPHFRCSFRKSSVYWLSIYLKHFLA